MASAEQLFTTSSLSLVVPDVSIELPEDLLLGSSADSWLARLSDTADRSQAFFDERLDFLLMIRMGHPLKSTPEEDAQPPGLLLAFLNHLQISLEATYISPQPSVTQSNHRLSLAPVRTSSAGRTGPRTLGASVPLFPPQTPRPTPSTVENDKQYVHSEGALLKSLVWGEDASQTEEAESFALLWSEREELWVAVYKLSIIVSFIRTNVPEPLLCLTASATLRDKPLPATPSRRILTGLIAAAGPLPPLSDPSPQGKPKDSEEDSNDDVTDFTSFEEVNLLDGLLAGPSFAPVSGSSALYLPSSRIGSSFRRDAYSLPPIPPTTPNVPTPNSGRTVPILRKSFRKTLTTVSGFRVRMRTVFVPHIFTPGSQNGDSLEEAGAEERTVVLCVEIENSGESGAGFAVESVRVSISGEGARVKLVGWGEKGFEDASKVFPLLIRSAEQYNLLYAVTFLGPSEAQEMQVSRRHPVSTPLTNDFQRAVAINVTGRPFDNIPLKESNCLSYPTAPFMSRWNCTLDLSPPRNHDSTGYYDSPAPQFARNVLPAPPSPFPPASPQTRAALDRTLALTSSQPTAIAGTRRHTYGGPSPLVSTSSSGASIYRPPTAMIINNNNPAVVSGIPSGRGTPPLRSVPGVWRPHTPSALNSNGALMSPPLPALPAGAPSPSEHHPAFLFPPPPQTPAYPAYASTPPPPRAPVQGPVVGQASSVGPSVEIRRERMLPTGVPQTPGPYFAAPAGVAAERIVVGGMEVAERLVVSVAVIPPQRQRHDATGGVDERIYPLDEFMLELFVFNQSTDVRRFEVSYPERKRYREERESGYPHSKAKKDGLGFMPLENRIRIGPLRPSTCQSTRMRFLAMIPGVHAIDALTLTDVESGVSTNLISVADIVVHSATL